MTEAILTTKIILVILSFLFSVLFWYWAKMTGLTLVIYKKIKKIIPLIGDIAYGVGISVVGAVLFGATSGMDLLSIKSFVGFFLIILGAILKH